MVTLIRKMGKTSGVDIPKKFLVDIGARQGDCVKLHVEGDRPVTTPARTFSRRTGRGRPGRSRKLEMTPWPGRYSPTRVILIGHGGTERCPGQPQTAVKIVALVSRSGASMIAESVSTVLTTVSTGASGRAVSCGILAPNERMDCPGAGLGRSHRLNSVRRTTWIPTLPHNA